MHVCVRVDHETLDELEAEVVCCLGVEVKNMSDHRISENLDLRQPGSGDFQKPPYRHSNGPRITFGSAQSVSLDFPVVVSAVQEDPGCRKCRPVVVSTVRLS